MWKNFFSPVGREVFQRGASYDRNSSSRGGTSLFLDIQMPELNGLEFSRMVNPETRIIFTTAFGQYALDSYKVNALDYLLKPISYADFLQSVNKAVQWYELKQKADNGADTDEPDDCIYVKVITNWYR